MRYYYYIFIPVFLLFSCKKEENVIVDNGGLSVEPVFTAYGNMPEGTLNLQAGINGAYMSTYSLNENSVVVNFGELTDYVSNSVAIGVHMGKDNPPEAFLVAAQDTLWFVRPWNDSYFQFTKNSLSNSSSITSIQWHVNGQASGVDDLTLTESGYYSICATVTFSGGETKQLCNDYLLGYNDPYRPQINFTSTGASVSANVSALSSVSNVNWKLDGNFVSNSAGLNYGLTSGIHVLTAEVTFDDGKVRTRSVLVSGNNADHYLGDFHEHQIAVPLDYLQDFRAEMFITSQGTAYEVMNDNNEAYILVENIEYFGLNAQNNEVYKLTAKVHAPIVPISGGSVHVTDLQIVFGIEIPQ